MRKCPHPNCSEMISPNVAMCPTHWRMLPDETKGWIMAQNRVAYAPGANQAEVTHLYKIIEDAAASLSDTST